MAESHTPSGTAVADAASPSFSTSKSIVGNSPALCEALTKVQEVASTNSTVLVYGETGTGKELIAYAIHSAGARKNRAFIEVNCGAIPDGLLESELFGCERGAFTGANAQRIGRFEMADHGTIFLDEIAELPLQLQSKLLRVLQEGKFERLGSSQPLRTDARIIAATNRDMVALVQEQKFRSDLYYRLNVFPIYVPSLRERLEDIPPLVHHFIKRFSYIMGKEIDGVSRATMRMLASHNWPGNVRELQNVIERAVIRTKTPLLCVTPEDLGLQPSSSRRATSDTLAEAQRKHILSVLIETNWVVGGEAGAAARLGVLRQTLEHRMRKLGISRPLRTRHDRRKSAQFEPTKFQETDITAVPLPHDSNRKKRQAIKHSFYHS
jgi:formate hydrogenlyase transcriptional activator